LKKKKDLETDYNSYIPVNNNVDDGSIQHVLNKSSPVLRWLHNHVQPDGMLNDGVALCAV